MLRNLLFTTIALLTMLGLVGCPSETDTGPGGAPIPGSPGGADGDLAFSGAVEQIDEYAPDFVVKDTDGYDVAKDDSSGMVLILDFWATTCAPCVKKLKEYEPIIARYADQGVELLAVSLDSMPEVAAGWAEKNKSPFHVVMLDSDLEASYFPDAIGAIMIPQVRIIDRNGNLRFKFGPDSTSADLELAIQQLVGEKVGGDEDVTTELMSEQAPPESATPDDPGLEATDPGDAGADGQ